MTQERLEYARKWQAENKDKVKGYKRKWRLANKHKEAEYARRHRQKYKETYRKKDYNWSLRRKYGITPEYFQTMIEQQAGLCAICCEPMKPGKDTQVDHNHVTGKVRGLVHNRCNLGIGVFKDSTETVSAMLSYLELHV